MIPRTVGSTSPAVAVSRRSVITWSMTVSNAAGTAKGLAGQIGLSK